MSEHDDVIYNITKSSKKMKLNKCLIRIILISNESLTSRHSPSIKLVISMNSGVEPSTDSACKEGNKRIKERI